MCERCVYRNSYTFSMAGCQGGGTASQHIHGSNAESQGIISHILADGIIEGTGLLSVEIKPDIICRAISGFGGSLWIKWETHLFGFIAPYVAEKQERKCILTQC